MDIVEGNMCGLAMRESIAQPWSKTPSRTKGVGRNLGDLAFGRAEIGRAGPHGEGDEPKSMMNEREKSDPAIVAVKFTNEAGDQGRSGRRQGGPREMRASKARSEHSVAVVCHTRWAAYGTPSIYRLSVTHPRWEPYAGKPHVPALCGGRIVICVPTAIPLVP